MRALGLIVCLAILTAGNATLLAAATTVHLRANQQGYLPDAAKTGLVLASNASLDGPFQVADTTSGQVIYEGAVERIVRAAWGRFPAVAQLDFSSVTRTGRFELRLRGTNSASFEIGLECFASFPDQLLEFMRQQRCGFNSWLNTECHAFDGRTAYGPLSSGTALDARGGWHDAADQLKYLLTSANATAQMLLAFQIAEGSKANPSLSDRCDAQGLPRADGIPDLLNEARWGLDWMLKLHPAPDQLYHQVADDRDHWGMRLPQNERADYGWGPGSNRVVYFANGLPQGLGRYQSESTGLANLAGRYAAAMALAAQLRTNYFAERFATRCLTAAKEVYSLGKAQEGVQQGNSFGAPYRYAETTWADDMEWGAAELFRATGQSEYLADARRYAHLAGSEGWMGRPETGHYQFYPFMNVGHFRLFAVVDDPFRAKLAAWYREGIERCRTTADKSPVGIGVPFIWCSNNLLVGLVTQCLAYEHMTGDSVYRLFMARHRDWLFGSNPWGYSMIMGVGSRSPQHPHLMTTHLTGRSLAGGLVDGPVYERIFKSLRGVSITEPDPLLEFQDAQAVYHDDVQDYSTNEPTMDGTASAILMWAMSLPGSSK